MCIFAWAAEEASFEVNFIDYMTFCDPPACGCCTSRSSAPDARSGPGRAAEEVLARRLPA
ncbi:MAG: hypothetical protein QGH91_04580 [Candidatus Marinimicrobia bacterium]|nr:hypothetical protein [Candidatus Neomarinimicrobiota bacterium]